MESILIKNALCVNEGERFSADVLIENGIIVKVEKSGITATNQRVIDAQGMWLLPGVIDDQVHFREPGLTHKADIESESKAAIAGGVTSFMDMPNVKPASTTQQLLEERYLLANTKAWANYSFYMGTTNDNAEEVLKTNPDNVCGIKIFMGSSTGNMLVDNYNTLKNIFSNAQVLIATHCENEAMILARQHQFKEMYGENVPWNMHPVIRNDEACFSSSEMAVNLAKETGARLHVLHISTAKEIALFTSDTPLSQKKITTEVCVHHLHFTADDYTKLGSLIKCNPAIKYQNDKQALWEALLNNNLDIIATDHAPHTFEEKQNTYFQAPAGLPLVQHSLLMMLEYAKEGWISLERVVEKMCHAPAECFQISKRGYLKEGYCADLVLVNPNAKTTVAKNNILYKCNWSPLEGTTFNHAIHSTFINGQLAYSEGNFMARPNAQRLLFNRR